MMLKSLATEYKKKGQYLPIQLNTFKKVPCFDMIIAKKTPLIYLSNSETIKLFHLLREGIGSFKFCLLTMSVNTKCHQFIGYV
jgi:hypothetical protein